MYSSVPKTSEESVVLHLAYPQTCDQTHVPRHEEEIAGMHKESRCKVSALGGRKPYLVGMTKFGMTKPHLVSGTSKMEVRFKNQRGATAKSITIEEYESVMVNTFLKDGKSLYGSMGSCPGSYNKATTPPIRWHL